MTAFIASVRKKSTGEVFYRLKGQLRYWTENRSEAGHYPTRDEAERAIAHTSSEKYDKFVGTAREIDDKISGLKFIAAVRGKESGKVRFRVAPTYPHLGPQPGWSEEIEDAHRFDTVEEAERVISLMSNASYDKKVGTVSQVKFWASQVDMRKLQEKVNADIKKIADFYQHPGFVRAEHRGGPQFGIQSVVLLPENGKAQTTPKEDPILALVETYIEKAQKIEEEGADEFTWRGFLHAFLKDVMESGK